MLHITNGDSAGGTIRMSGVTGTVLPWRDVLHEGPLPAGLTLREMSRLRAEFIGSAEWGAPGPDIEEEFRARDATLLKSLEEDEVVLWFEADLYDQLQILQVLDWFAGQGAELPPLSLICIGEYPGFTRFDGLGQLSPAQMFGLFPERKLVRRQQLDLARAGWAAVTSATPEALQHLLTRSTGALEFLAPALVRLLEEYPWTTNGLSRTENQVLQVVADGASRFAAIFPACAALEERVFMGDSVLWDRLLALTKGKGAALAVDGSEVSLTALGRAYLEGQADFYHRTWRRALDRRRASDGTGGVAMGSLNPFGQE
jgi:hypothetical protein